MDIRFYNFDIFKENVKAFIDFSEKQIRVGKRLSLISLKGGQNMPDSYGGRGFFGGNNLILFLLLIILVGDCLCSGDHCKIC